jgi:glycerol-3-phosphate dehydrogenase (NAD(P)+)
MLMALRRSRFLRLIRPKVGLTTMERAKPTVVVGGGSWGTALANHLAVKGEPTTIWAREPEVVEGVNTERENPIFLPDVTLDDSLSATGDLRRSIREAEVIISSVPTQHVRAVWSGVADVVPAEALIVTVSKGIEIDTLATPSAILADVLGEGAASRIVALSGPSFAREVAARHPTAVVAAGADADRTRLVQELFSSEVFRVYTSPDVTGAELGGALKNVIALAAGVVEGLRYGHNTMAALMTRGLAEISRLGVALGGDPFTFAGLSGMGDLILTCTGGLSRNRTVGVELGRGRSLRDIEAEMNMVAEGVKTTKAVKQLSESVGIEMPICDQVYAVLYEDKPVADVARDLMIRPLTHEGSRPPA